MKLTWIPSELHTHTTHSDGQHSLSTLIKSATELGLTCIALTDHNTISGHFEFNTMKQSNIKMIRGMEWTTFFGHMLTLGISEYEEWRDLGLQDIEKGIERVHQRGGIVGIAHPFRVGSPICTGCHWEFEVSDWTKINYIEVWSGLFPSVKRESIRAYELWTELLNKGYKISGVSGRDWHSGSFMDEPIAVTYLGVGETKSTEFERAAVEALRKGQVSVTMGPLLQFSIVDETHNQKHFIGDTAIILDDTIEVTTQIELDFSSRNEFWDLEDQEFKVSIISNRGILTNCKLSKEQPSASVRIPIKDLQWLRAELFGVIYGVSTMIAFTNPIYFQRS